MGLRPQDLDKLADVHPDLASVIERTAALAGVEQFVVTEGRRAQERQLQLFLAGKSKTMRSRHLTGHAVDLAVWHDRDADKVVDADELSWKFPEYQDLADLVKQAADELGIPIEWGGDWKFKDGPHFQLPWANYP
jgi:peptidoglycan L-alanyl-D-glutamate endopeptidase CwlK